MDLLFPSPAWASPSIRIPFVDGFQYSASTGTFYRPDASVHCRGASARITPTQVNSLRAQDRAAFLQAWLFFGLFSAFFGRDIHRQWFVQQDGMGQFVTIVVADPATMDALMGEWARQLEHLSPAARSDAIDQQMRLLNFAADQCDLFDAVRLIDRKVDRSRDVHTLARVLLSIRLAIAYLRSSTKVIAQKSRIGDTVAKALKLVDTSQIDNEWGKVFVPTPPGGQPPLSAMPLLEEFKRNRWCPIRARRLCELYDYSVVNYLSRVPRLDPQNVTHSLCEGGTRCKAYDFDETRQAAYQPKHTAAGCRCSDLGTASEKLVDIITSGNIPILSIDPSVADLDLQVHKYDGSKRYTAISHVWSDGLGNPHENALPQCQIRKIAQILSNLKQRNWRYLYWEEKAYQMFMHNPFSKERRRVYFWMDTLCIPVNVPAGCRHSVKEVKHMAIRHITPIFQVADQVLVLDAELEQLSLKSPDDDEMTPEQIANDEEALAARILGCKWLQRAWTLEEGSLAKSCQFKVADETTTIDLGELVPVEKVSRHFFRDRRRCSHWKKKRKEQAKMGGSLLKPDLETGSKSASLTSQDSLASATGSHLPHFETPLKLLLAGSLNENRKQAMRHGLKGKYAKTFLKSRGVQYIEAWNELLSRSATKPNDALLIMANILDFNSAAIAAIKPSENRLPTIIRSSLEVPLGLLFNSNNRIRYCHTPKDSWIPTAIDGDRLTGSALLTRATTEDNFRLTLSHCKDTLRAFVVRRKIPFTEQCVLIEIGGPMGSSEQYIVEICPPVKNTNTPAWAQQLRASYEEGDPDSCLLLMDFTAGSSSANGYACRGALLSILGAMPKHLHVRYNTEVTIWTWDQWSERPDMSLAPIHTFLGEPIPRDYVLELDYDASNGLSRQGQRRLLKPYTHNVLTKINYIAIPIAWILSIVLFYVAVPQCDYYNTITGNTDYADASSGHQDPKLECEAISYISGSIVDVLIPVIMFYVWKLWRKHKYRKWLRTFTGE